METASTDVGNEDDCEDKFSEFKDSGVFELDLEALIEGIENLEDLIDAENEEERDNVGLVQRENSQDVYPEFKR